MRSYAANDFDAIRKALKNLRSENKDVAVDFLIMPCPRNPNAFAWKAISYRAMEWMGRYYANYGPDEWHFNFSNQSTPAESAAEHGVAAMIRGWSYRAPTPDEKP